MGHRPRIIAMIAFSPPTPVLVKKVKTGNNSLEEEKFSLQEKDIKLRNDDKSMNAQEKK